MFQIIQGNISCGKFDSSTEVIKNQKSDEITHISETQDLDITHISETQDLDILNTGALQNESGVFMSKHITIFKYYIVCKYLNQM